MLYHKKLLVDSILIESMILCAVQGNTLLEEEVEAVEMGPSNPGACHDSCRFGSLTGFFLEMFWAAD